MVLMPSLTLLGIFSTTSAMDSPAVSTCAELTKQETFTIIRDLVPPEMAVDGIRHLWAGYNFQYGDHMVGLSIGKIYQGTPATKAGMVVGKHEDWLIVGVNGQECEPTPEDPCQTADALLGATKEGDRISQPFTLTLRPLTDEEVERTCGPRINQIVDFVAAMPAGGMPGMPEGMTGKDMLRVPQCVEMVQRLCKVEGREVQKMNILMAALQRHGWQGRMSMSINVTVAAPRGSNVDLDEVIADVKTKAQELADECDLGPIEVTTSTVRTSDFDRREAAMDAEKLEILQRITREERMRDDKVTTDDDAVCFVCTENEPKVAFLHGETAHGCVCYACAARLAFHFRAPYDCPMCRQQSDMVPIAHASSKGAKII